MSRLAVVVALIGAFAGTAYGQRDGRETLEAPDTAGAWEESLRQEVLGMQRKDQEVREDLVELMQGGGEMDSARARRLVARQDSVDRANTERLKEIIARHGWPSTERAGREVAGAAFLIVQHATHDLAFQKAYLEFLEAEYELGRVPGEAVALLTDRTRQAEGKLQLYGTQATIQDGELVLDPIEDEDGVDVRRKALGLPPLAEYLEQLRKAYGLPDPDAGER